MRLTNLETQKLLLAKDASEISEVLRSAQDLSAWKGAEPITDHAQCLFEGLSQYNEEQRASLFAKELSLTPAEQKGGVNVEFYGALSDEELENVSAAGGCIDPSLLGFGPFLKPVIYLYPERETAVTVEISQERMRFTCVYPPLKDGRWTVTAEPDGTLYTDGMAYNYLYWEGAAKEGWADLSRGFCVPAADTAAFLEKSLAALGLNRREANEMIVYWLPLLERNPYNRICFQFEAYHNMAPLHITPAPDTLIRVYMVCTPLRQPIEIEPQTLTAPERRGFTVVEWGGTI